MTEYIGYFSTGASVAVVIEADSLEEAEEKFEEFDDLPTLCASCSGWGQKPGITLGDWEPDGSVEVR